METPKWDYVYIYITILITINQYLTIINNYLTIINHYSTIINHYLTIINHYSTIMNHYLWKPPDSHEIPMNSPCSGLLGLRPGGGGPFAGAVCLRMSSVGKLLLFKTCVPLWWCDDVDDDVAVDDCYVDDDDDDDDHNFRYSYDVGH